MWFVRKRRNIKKSEAPFTIEVDGVSVLVTRKDVKYLRLRFILSKDEVHASVPYGVGETEIASFVGSHADWIKKKRLQLKEQTVFVDENEIFLLGKRYQLCCFSDSKPSYAVMENSIHLYLVDPASVEQKNGLLQQLYRASLQSELDVLMPQWSEAMGVVPKEWRIRQMRTRWGTCNTVHKRVWFNLELAKRSRRLVEYIVVHELCHLFERGHNARFYAYMDRFLPDWCERKHELNKVRM